MTAPVLPFDPETLLLSVDAAREAGRMAADRYRVTKPYPHGCFDNFIDPAILDRVTEELRTLPEAETFFNSPQEKLKTSYMPERLAPYTRSLFYALNARPFLTFLEELTGIQGLIPDPYFAGGGIHVVANGGHLDIHADFNHHGKLNLEGRINVLIYLNHGWERAFANSTGRTDVLSTSRESGGSEDSVDSQDALITEDGRVGIVVEGHAGFGRTKVGLRNRVGVVSGGRVPQSNPIPAGAEAQSAASVADHLQASR